MNSCLFGIILRFAWVIVAQVRRLNRPLISGVKLGEWLGHGVQDGTHPYPLLWIVERQFRYVLTLGFEQGGPPSHWPEKDSVY